MPTVEELQAEISALRAEAKTVDTPPNGAAGQPQPGDGPVTPQIVAVFLRDGGVLTTTVGAIQLSPQEIKKISKIAARAFKRAMADVVAAISEKPAQRKTQKPAKRAKRRKSAGPRLSKTGKPLGRPKKAKTVSYEKPVERPSAVVITAPSEP